MKKRLISIFMTVVMVLSLFQGTGVRVNASDPELPEISYIDASGEEQYIGGPEGSDYTVVESSPDSVTWESGWYVVSNEGDVHLPSGAIVDGEVHLILMDGAQLTASNEAGAGITVRGSGNSLTVYGQTEGAGLLSATGSYCNAGIDNGSDNPDEIGSITINGGTIEARGGQAGAGIGGGFFCHSGNITINGGTVTATGGDDDSGAAASGIGGGGGGSARNIYINGGSVTAIGGYDSGMADGDGAGIARGGCCDEEQIENIKVSTGLIIRQGGSADDTAVVENDGNDLKDTLTGRYVSINEPEYLTFTSESAFSVALTKDGDAPTVYLQYSTDKTDWNDWDLSAVSAEEKAGVGYVIYFRNGSDEEETYTTNAVLSGDCVFNTFTFSAESGEVPPIAASGNIMTLLDYKNPAVEMTDNNKYAFARLFYYCTSLSEAPLLPATTLADFCYFSMFVGCTSLTEAPSLPAEKMTDNCYNGMFAECTSLSEAPLLPATELADGCYCTMFYGCTSLTVAPELKAEALAPNCYWCMFTECPGLYVTEQDSAEGATWTIPVATGVDSPVDNMFTDTAAGGASVPTDLSSEHYYKVVPAYALKSDSSLTGQGGVTFKVNNTEGSPVAATTAAEGVTVTAVATEVTDYKATLTAVDEDGQSVSIAADGTFTMPAKAVTVKATYNSVVASVDFGGTTGVKKYSSLQDAINAASTGTETSPMTTAVKVTLLEDIIENISISKYQMIELDLSGHLLTGKGDHIVVSISGDLKISDSGNTVRYWMPDTTGLWKLQASRPESGEAGKDYFTTTGGVITGGTGWLSDSYSWGGGVYVYSNAKLTVGGGNIVGNTATYGGGVESNGTFTMEGGTISGNTATYGGGLMNYYGTFTMEGGTISGNTSSYCGGGVENRGTFTMKGGTISTNSAPYGGGVCTSSGTFTMEGGTISGNTATSGGGVYNYNGSTFTMGGTISGNTATSGGGGVFNASSGTFTMEGGTIGGNTASYGGGVQNNGIHNLQGGEISGNTAPYGGGVYNVGTFTMEGGTISGNTSSYCGGGVENYGTFTMKGGTISTNSAPYGGGVCSDSGTFTMEDGTISGNTSTASGGGVYSGSTFTMKGGTISGNTAAYGGGVYNASTFTMKGGTVSGGEATYGGGMFNASTGTLTMEGGTIGGNTASEGGGVGNNGTLNLLGGEISANKGDASGGVAVWSTYYPVTVGGSLVIKDNTLSDGSTASNMCITSGAVINFATGDNAPTEDMNISVSPAPGTPAQNVFVKDQNDYSSYISIDDSGYTLVNEHDKLLLVSEDAEEVAKQNSTGELFYLLENAIAASSTGTAEASMTTAAKVTLVADTTENISIGSYQKIELDLNGHVLSGKGNYIVINISGDLKISDSGDTVRFWEPDSTGLWKLLASQPQSGEAGKDYFITTGGVITGGTGWYSGSSSYGGGAYVNSGAQLTLSGGNIVGNTATSGGGLYIYDGTFTMEGGIISGNTATYGSGVDVYSGTFTMKAGSIEGNTATYGGGVYNGGTFTMEGGTITGNKAFYGESSTYGGGVYNWTTFTFTGGTISDNTASYGGGVYHGRYGTDCTSADSVFTMSGTAKITGNTASVNGGGIATEEFGTLYLMGGEISANQAAESGGVQVYSSTHPVTVGGSIVITGNTDGDDDRASDLHLCYDYNTVSISTATPLTTGASIGVIRESGNIGAFTSNGTETDAQYFFPDNPAYRVTYVDTVGTEGGEGYVAAHLELAKFAINALSKTVESIDLADASMTDAQAIAIMTDDGTAHTDGIVVYAVSGGNYSYLEYVSSAWSKAGETKTLSELVEVTKVYVIGGITEKDLAEVDFGGITGTVKYKTVQAAIDAASADSEEAAKTVKLLTNVDVPATLTVASGKYVTLDLAGHVLSGKDITAPANEGDKASVIYNEGNLTIKDSAGTTNTRYWVPDATGLWQLQDSTPSGTEGTDYFTTTGGCITGGKGYQVASGGLSGGGVYNLGTFNLTGGNIVGNTAYFGGGVHNSGTLNLTGGNIVGNVAVYGGGVCNNGPLNLSGSNIVGNTATDSGGGVCNGMGAVMNFSSGSISGNHAIIGGGIVNNLNVLIMTGGSVTDNTITAASGTIYDSFGGAGIYQNGKMYIGGAAVIKNNKTNGVLDNLFCKKNTLTVAVDPDGNPIPSLASGAEIWINAGTSTGQITANGAAEDAQYFHSDNPAYRVKFVEATTDPEAAAHLELAKFDIATLTATVKGIDLADTAMTDTQAIAIMTDDGTDHSDGIVVYAVSGGNYSYLVYDSAWSKAASTMTLSELKQEDKVYIIGEITEKTELTLSATVADVNWTGEKVTDPTVTAKLDQTTKDDVSGYDFAYYDMENETSKLSENPSEAGYYKLVISIKDDDSNYYGTSETYYFLIKPVINNVDGESGITTGTDYVKNEQVNLELHSSADLKDFIKVMVTKPGAKEAELVPDNEGANYTVADGSIKVTLKKAYLDTLESGTYVFHIISGINTGTAQNPEWMKDVLQKTIEFSADITVEISDGCKYEACFAAGTNVTLLLGGKEAGKYTIAKVSNGYTIQDGTEYIALSADGKSIVRQAGSYTWKYDGGLYGEMKTTTTTKVLFWSRKSTKTTKVYLAMGTEDLTVSSKSAAAKLQVTGSHEWAYKDNNDGSTHKVYCSHCGKVKAEAEQHDYSYDETNHKCICGHVDPDFSGVKTVTVKETSKTSKTSGSHRFGRSSRTKTTYTYTISTTQVNVKVKTIAYSLLEGGKMQQIKNKQFTSDSKLSGFYIDVTDSNGVVTHWYYDGTKTTQLEEQSPQ